MSYRRVQAEAVTLGLVFHIALFEVLVHLSCKDSGLLCTDSGILEFVIEIVAALGEVGVSREVVEFQAHSFRCLIYRIDELTFVELLSGDGDDAVHLLDHMDARSLAEWGSGLDYVVHIVAVQAAEGGYERAILLAFDKLVELVERSLRVIELGSLLELVVVEMREEHGLYAVVQHKAGTAL